MTGARLNAFVAGIVAAHVGCNAKDADPRRGLPAPTASVAPERVDAAVDPPAPTIDAGDAERDACPADMAFVQTSYCPDPVMRCLSDEYNAPNHLTICKRFAPGQSCAGPERNLRFCIDRYEYPNERGAHPKVMVDAYDAEALCEARGKRLCFKSEWESACEGPEKLPFPYGLVRSAEKCNIDNVWINPDLDRLYSPAPLVATPELLRLDQSVRSGAKEGCVSGFGVHDLTGNVDEWIFSEEPRGKARWAGLKGGAWGHVRNACRPMTTSHPPDFTYYFISFRCCADATGEAPIDPWKHPPVPSEKKTTPLRKGWVPPQD